nr:hypothetical protein [Tanacetum cinerariifolium]
MKSFGHNYGSITPVGVTVCKTRTFALGDKPHSFFAPEGKPPRRGLNPRPLACGNNLPKVTLDGLNDKHNYMRTSRLCSANELPAPMALSAAAMAAAQARLVHSFS